MINQGQIDQITATSLLEDLKSTEAKTKINAIHNLRGISFALGRERTRKELLPFLASYIDEEEDDILNTAELNAEEKDEESEEEPDDSEPEEDADDFEEEEPEPVPMKAPKQKKENKKKH